MLVFSITQYIHLHPFCVLLSIIYILLLYSFVSMFLFPSFLRLRYEICCYYLQPAGLLMDHMRIRRTWIRWLLWELHPQRPRKGGGDGESESGRMRNVKWKTRGGGGWGAAVGRVMDGERGNGEGGMERKRRREAHFYQSEIFDSAERVTLERKTKAGRLSLSFSPFVFLITPLLHPPPHPPFIKDISAIFTYNRKITLAHLLNSSFCS